MILAANALAAALLLAAGPIPAPQVQTLRCATSVIVSTPRGYHTAASGDVYFDVMNQSDGATTFSYRVHPGVHPSIALALRDCVLATCAGTMTRDSYTLASDRMADDALVTIDIGRVNGEYVATSRTRDLKGSVVRVLTERGSCASTGSAPRF